MGAGLVTVGRRTYAVGLYWENSPAGRLAQTARDAAIQSGGGYKYYALRNGVKDGRVPQFGLLQDIEGAKPGAPVFAACIANQQPGSWAGAFKFREGIAVVVVRDDLLVPDGDVLFEREDEARDRLLQEIGFGGLQRVFAPESWAIPGADSMPISLLLNEVADIKLRAATVSKKPLLYIAGGVAAVLVLATGYWLFDYQQALEQQKITEEITARDLAKRNAATLVPDAFKNQVVKPKPPERTWEKEPDPSAIMAACVDALKKIPVAISGWKMDSLSCGKGQAVSIWSRSGGVTTPPAFMQYDPKGDKATYSLNYAAVPARGEQQLMDSLDFVKYYLAREWPGSVAALPDDPLQARPDNYNGEWRPIQPNWVKRSFTITVGELPMAWNSLLGGISGVVINTLNYKPAAGLGGGWDVAGVIYTGCDFENHDKCR